jgi:hypothetical protein
LKGGSQAERDDREALGRSRGGYGTKACGIADASGRAIAFRIAPGQAHELPHAIPLLEKLPGVPMWVVKEWRAIATRYEKTARSFMGVLCLAATLDWIKR